MVELGMPSLFINRELSWLAFNHRVLHEALDQRTPLLERVKFLSIFANNLDEFYMVRVAGLRRQVAAGVVTTPADGLSPQEQLDAIDRVVHEHLGLQRQCLKDVLGALADSGVRLVGMSELTHREWASVDEFFESQVFPILTPLAVDPGHPFPYISNLSLSLAVEMHDPANGEDRFARVKVPKRLPRFVPVPDRPRHFIPLEQVIGTNLTALFPGMEIRDWSTFRITRYSDLELPVEEPEDLLAMIEEQVFARRFGEVVRLEVQDEMPAHIRALLLNELQAEDVPQAAALAERDVQQVGSLLDLTDLMALWDLDLPALKDPPFTPIVPIDLRDQSRSMFEVIRERDILLHHPYESFSASIERFLQTAARDENVLAIKLTLYRTSGDTTIVAALREAAQTGKQVAVMVELKARFEEANNISWARALEDYGVHVAYGSAQLKTHAKVALVVRREGGGIRRYVHLGTGNYNARTARQYTDLGFLTASPSIAADVTDLFNSLTGYARGQHYRKLLVAPAHLRAHVIEMIDREAERSRQGMPARIIAKMNALVDPDTIQALYRASQAGVEIDLIVRGICCLRPGLPEVSEHIRVVSIVGRFLEHSRLWYFAAGGDDEYYIGSADWMQRNFDRRVEAVVPIEDRSVHPRLARLLQTYLADNRQAWDLGSDGSWVQRVPGAEPVRSAQDVLLRDPSGRGEKPGLPSGEPVLQVL